MYAPESNEVTAEFMEQLNFIKYGYLPDELQRPDGTTENAIVWAMPLHSRDLIDYTLGRDELTDLSRKDLHIARKRRIPPWLRSFAIHFILPIVFVGAIFLISFMFVYLGPLKGIGKSNRREL